MITSEIVIRYFLNKKNKHLFKPQKIGYNSHAMPIDLKVDENKYWVFENELLEEYEYSIEELGKVLISMGKLIENNQNNAKNIKFKTDIVEGFQKQDILHIILSFDEVEKEEELK